MSNNENALFPSDPSRSGPTISAQQPEPLESQGGRWAGLPGLPHAAPFDAPNLYSFLHALRRHWILTAFIGLLLAPVIGLAIWFGYGPSYESAAYLSVATGEPALVFQTAGGGNLGGRSEFDVYRNNQVQLIKSRPVMMTALRDVKLKEFNIDQRETDAVAWLMEKIKVKFPGDGSIMEVSLVRPDPKEAQLLVNAVVNAYLSDVVDVERNRKRQRLNELDRTYADHEARVRLKRNEVKQLAEQLGVSDNKNLSLKQQIGLQDFGMYQQHLTRTQIELRQARASLDSQKVMLSNLSDQEIPAFEVDNYARNDPQAKQLAEQLAMQRMAQAYTSANLLPGKKNSYTDRYRTDLEMIQQQYDDLLKSMREGIRNMKRSDIEKERLKKELEVEALTDQVQEFSKEVEKKKGEAEKLSVSSIDLEMMHTEIEQLARTLNGIADEREKLNVEIHSAPRVTPLQVATEPKAEILFSVRIALTVLGMLVGVCVPAGVIVLSDVRKQRINSPGELKALGLSVVGAVPAIPARAIHRLGSPSRRQQSWHLRLTESVDTIAAHLHRRAAIEQHRVILVSSAVTGEGKTTLATQLALSFARTGRRTILLDFDLRQPALHTIFGMPLEPGLSDVLRGQCTIAEVIRPTGSESLAIITAGQWDRQTMAALANGGAGLIFEKLRGQYEFIVLDSSPILPVADTRFVSQHVDAAILCVFRDVSEAPRVQAAQEILEAFGVRTVDVAMTGPRDQVSHNHFGAPNRQPA